MYPASLNVILDIGVDVEDPAAEFNILEMPFLGAPLVERMDTETRALGNFLDGEQMIHLS